MASRFKTSVGTPGFFWLYVRRWGILLKNHLPTVTGMVGKDEALRAELERARVIKRWMRT
jgi:hypothetical protein